MNVRADSIHRRINFHPLVTIVNAVVGSYELSELPVRQ